MKVEVDESTRQIALKVSDIVNVDEIEAFLITKSYLTFSVDDGSDVADRVVLWYAEEALAVPQIALAILKLSDEEGELGQLAHDVRTEALSEQSKHIEGLFRSFSGLAQRSLDEKQRSWNALFW